MADDMEEDLFADLYDGDETTNPAPTSTTKTEPTAPDPVPIVKHEPGYGEEPESAAAPINFDNEMAGNGEDDDNDGGQNYDHSYQNSAPSPEPFHLKEDGKMFIGGLNWETTDKSLHDYFSQFGEVQECTVMRDGATGRSRGFGFLTFKDPKTVNTVMVKEHFLDGKIIDPKRAIPRDEQEKTSKIFVGGVSQDATEADFTSFFAQFGRVVDATLMMDKDTGRPRGFGFVTFDSEAAVEKVLDYHPLEILGKPIEVKKAQPRGKIGEEDDFQRGGRSNRGGKFGREDRFSGNDNSNNMAQNQQPQAAMMGAGGMTPQMMAQYWQRMQQYFAMMQQQMAASAMGGMGGMSMNPQMMAQMQQMQQMQGGKSPNGGAMNPQMQQQMMQMMQMQNGGMGMGGGQMGSMGPSQQAFSAQEQLAFEQQKYEQQSNRRGPRGGSANGSGSFSQQQGGPQSWEGMYDDVPQPDGGNGGGRGPVRNMTPQGGRKGTTPQPNNAPANAPTGPKNAGKPGANFRGGRGGNRFHPYGR